MLPASHTPPRVRRLSEADEPENSPEIVEAARRCVEQFTDVSRRARAAKHIQKRWRQYRDAVAELEMLGSDDDDDCVRSVRSASGRGEHPAGATPTSLLRPSTSSSSSSNDADGLARLDRRGSQRSSLRQSLSSTDECELESIILSILTTAGGDYQDDDGAARDEIIREYAATIIQRRVRRSLLRSNHHQRGDTETPPLSSDASGHLNGRHLSAADSAAAAQVVCIPDAAVNALRILQNRFRFQRFRRMIEERERNELIRRVQQLWRRRKDLKRHFEAVRHGREDAAARDIQRAYLNHVRGSAARATVGGSEAAAVDRRPLRSVERIPRLPALKSIGAASNHLPTAAPEATSVLPTCIICMAQTVQIAFLPCGHAHVCVVCGAQCQRCPTCRKMIALQLRIYL